tara:strand:- start:1336 stop:1536 length:201 start_codon:yes stop_codon:yes gene_type:complete
MKISIFTFISLFSINVMAHPGHENIYSHHEVNSIFSSILAILFLTGMFFAIKKITKNALSNIEKKG